MKIVSWNVCGIGDRIMLAVVKNMLYTYRVDVGLLQETKLSSVSDSVVKDIWGCR